MALGQGVLAGKKTYIMAGMGVLGAIAMYLTGDLSLTETLRVIYDSGLIAALRGGVAKVAP